MNDKFEDITPELRSILERESRSYSKGEFDQQAVWRGVEFSALALAPGSGLPDLAPKAAAGGGIAKGAALSVVAKKAIVLASLGGLVVGGAIGGTVGVVATKRLSAPQASAVPSLRISTPPNVSASSSAESLPPGAGDVKPETLPSVPASALPAASTRSATRVSTDLREEERRVLDVARSALVRENYGEAILALDRHGKAFPSGELAEERDALRIQALALSGSKEAAAARAKVFYARYPKSLHRTSIERALGR